MTQYSEVELVKGAEKAKRRAVVAYYYRKFGTQKAVAQKLNMGRILVCLILKKVR